MINIRVIFINCIIILLIYIYAWEVAKVLINVRNDEYILFV